MASAKPGHQGTWGGRTDARGHPVDREPMPADGHVRGLKEVGLTPFAPNTKCPATPFGEILGGLFGAKCGVAAPSVRISRFLARMGLTLHADR